MLESLCTVDVCGSYLGWVGKGVLEDLLFKTERNNISGPKTTRRKKIQDLSCKTKPRFLECDLVVRVHLLLLCFLSADNPFFSTVMNCGVNHYGVILKILKSQ